MGDRHEIQEISTRYLLPYSWLSTEKEVIKRIRRGFHVQWSVWLVVNGFIYAAESGYMLNQYVAGYCSGATLLDTGVWTCEPNTHELTCKTCDTCLTCETCFHCETQDTCDTCDTCTYTCGSTCPATCPFTCLNC